ncbi:hypothetical protein [Streptomyces sp. NPDC058964]|uniref:hypothetical protein n=1 Tax=Streptomyces sp. NPDC058964 TaxID=3346681 RepID=UPI0036763D3B
MSVHAGRLARTARLTMLLTAAAVAPALSLSPAATRPADAANLAPTAAQANPSAGVAVIYKIPGEPKYFRVHNALLLDEKSHVGIKIAHVASWNYKTDGDRPRPEQFWVCFHPQKKECPTTPRKVNWVLNSYHEYANQKCPTRNGVTYCPGPFVAYKSSARPHNGAFTCWRPASSASACPNKWPGDNKIYQSAGRLTFDHYENPNPPQHAPAVNHRSYANHPGDFKFVVRTVGGQTSKVSAQRICYLLPTPCPKQ